jgi:aspartyl-tRNA(Asn)/glutamyl-tRNA(Gln) amidotransferase subunit C
MSISTEQLTATAKLAKLRLDPQHVNEVTNRITAILDLVDQMQSVDTSDVAPMAHPLDATQQLRLDEVVEPDDKIGSRERFQAIAPASEAGLYLVPKVIE